MLFSACASTSQLSPSDAVKIVLNNGDKISAEIVDIGRSQIVFKARSWKQAYEYGEVIDVQRVKGIQLKDGTLLSLSEYRDFRDGKLSIKKGEKVAAKKTGQTVEKPAPGEDFQYAQLKKKPIAEMTDNEYRYFLMMKQRELDEKKAAERKRQERASAVESDKPSGKFGSRVPTVAVPPAESDKLVFDELVNSILESGLASDYIVYLQHKKQSQQALSVSEARVLSMLENNPRWQAKLDDLRYINDVAQRAFSRAFLYNPEDLQDKIGLNFDADRDMDYFGLMEQLHQLAGDKVRMSDFRILIEVFGETGAKAIKDILENYASWKYALAKPAVTFK